ncbi:MAG TPA: hypothetical protein VK629_18805 [Steroidobacteraceae bacterium]|nr:hypothetical protein [Steroidobacteraceae bacterium]
MNHPHTWKELNGPRLSPLAWEEILSWQSLSGRALFPPGDFPFLRRFIRYVVGKRYRTLDDRTTVRLADRTRVAFLASLACVTFLFVLGCLAKVAKWVA